MSATGPLVGCPAAAVRMARACSLVISASQGLCLVRLVLGARGTGEGAMVGLFGKKKPVELGPLSLDEAKDFLHVPRSKRLHEVDHLWSLKLESCSLPQDVEGYWVAELRLGKPVVPCFVNGRQVGVVHPRFRATCLRIVQLTRRYRLPVLVSWTGMNWKVQVDMSGGVVPDYDNGEDDDLA